MRDVVYGSAVRAPAHGSGWPADCPLFGTGPTVGPRSAAEESMGTRDGQQKGAQQHAEGEHGEKTRSRILEQIHDSTHRDDEQAEDDGASESGRGDGQRR